MNFLIGDKVRLVKFTKDNITDEYLGWLNDPAVNRYLCVGRFPIVKDDISIYDGEKKFLFAIMAKDMDRHTNADPEFIKYIGTLSLHNIDWICRKGEVGYMIGNKQYWGKGIATEIVRLITDYGFKRINLNKLYAGVISGNAHSDAALLKNGYKHYATIPQEYFLEGKYLDSNMYYKLQGWHLGEAR